MAPVARQIESIRAQGADVRILEIRGVKRLKYLQCLGSLRSMARSVDLIHAHYGYCGWLSRSQFHKPVVVSFMGSDLLGAPDASGRVSLASRLVVQADRWLARAVDAVIVKSPGMAQVVAPVQAHVIPNGVDVQVFQPKELPQVRRLLGWPEGRRYVMFPGDPANPRKAYPLARAAVKRAAPWIREPVELFPLSGISPEHVSVYMNACDAMLLTSFLEGSPNVVKEALACNLPVVSVPVGDVADLLAGVAGCALCPRDPDALAGALVHILREPNRTDGRIALQRKGLDLQSVAQKVISLYEAVLAPRVRQGEASCKEPRSGIRPAIAATEHSAGTAVPTRAELGGMGRGRRAPSSAQLRGSDLR
jgi:glycosyltransferase involved in cell wall biosynthesis